MLLSFSLSVAFGLLFYADYERIFSYDLETDEKKKILHKEGFEVFSQFCINYQTNEMYYSGFHSSSSRGVYDLEGRQKFDVNIWMDLFSSNAMVIDERNDIVYSIDGQQVDQIIVDSTQYIDMKNLNDGAYFYTLIKDNRTSIKGRFVRM